MPPSVQRGKEGAHALPGGVAAYRVIGEINRLAWRADGQFQPVDGLMQLDAAWERADQALRERGRIVKAGGDNREAAT